MKRILPEDFLTALRLFLYIEWEFLISAFKFRRVENICHSFRKSLRLRNRISLPCLASRSDCSKLEINSLLNKPRCAARRSKRCASSSTITLRRPAFNLISTPSLEVIILLYYYTRTKRNRLAFRNSIEFLNKNLRALRFR